MKSPGGVGPRRVMRLALGGGDARFRFRGEASEHRVDEHVGTCKGCSSLRTCYPEGRDAGSINIDALAPVVRRFGSGRHAPLAKVIVGQRLTRQPEIVVFQRWQSADIADPGNTAGQAVILREHNRVHGVRIIRHATNRSVPAAAIFS